MFILFSHVFSQTKMFHFPDCPQCLSHSPTLDTVYPPLSMSYICQLRVVLFISSSVNELRYRSYIQLPPWVSEPLRSPVKHWGLRTVLFRCILLTFSDYIVHLQTVTYTPLCTQSASATSHNIHGHQHKYWLAICVSGRISLISDASSLSLIVGWF